MFSHSERAQVDPEGASIHHGKDEEVRWRGWDDQWLEVCRHGCGSPLSHSVHLVHHYRHHHCPPLCSSHYCAIVLAHPSQVLSIPCLCFHLSRARHSLWRSILSTSVISDGWGSREVRLYTADLIVITLWFVWLVSWPGKWLHVIIFFPPWKLKQFPTNWRDKEI